MHERHDLEIIVPLIRCTLKSLLKAKYFVLKNKVLLNLLFHFKESLSLYDESLISDLRQQYHYQW